MSSENPSGADNQQGRPKGLLTPDYVVGFVDGEGCFSVSIRPHPTVTYGSGCVIGTVFAVSQHRDNLDVLIELNRYFGIGKIRSKGPSSSVMVYNVTKRDDLRSAIIPFFQRHPLRTSKQQDFLKFREVVDLMSKKAHRTDAGFRRIVELAFSMNRRGKQRRYTIEQVLPEPSETVRRALEPAALSDDPVRSSWRHGEGDRNDRPATQASFEWR
jgi:LAGLIDADG endonuclease